MTEIAQLRRAERETAATILENLRLWGWAVAVHNDYWLGKERATFWLFTRDNRECVKGEGRTDLEALRRVVDELRAREALASPPAEPVGERVEGTAQRMRAGKHGPATPWEFSLVPIEANNNDRDFYEIYPATLIIHAPTEPDAPDVPGEVAVTTTAEAAARKRAQSPAPSTGGGDVLERLDAMTAPPFRGGLSTGAWALMGDAAAEIRRLCAALDDAEKHEQDRRTTGDRGDE